jgi:hypothetical protein
MNSKTWQKFTTDADQWGPTLVSCVWERRSFNQLLRLEDENNNLIFQSYLNANKTVVSGRKIYNWQSDQLRNQRYYLYTMLLCSCCQLKPKYDIKLKVWGEQIQKRWRRLLNLSVSDNSLISLCVYCTKSCPKVRKAVKMCKRRLQLGLYKIAHSSAVSAFIIYSSAFIMLSNCHYIHILC